MKRYQTNKKLPIVIILFVILVLSALGIKCSLNRSGLTTATTSPTVSSTTSTQAASDSAGTTATDLPTATTLMTGSIAVGNSQIPVSISGDKTYTVKSIYCPSSSNCIAVGASHNYSVILKSNNSGSTWIDLRTSKAGDLEGVTCITSIDCIAVGANRGSGVILNTNNQGSTWTNISIPSQIINISSIICSMDNCVAVGWQDYFKSIQPVILFSSNSGSSFTTLSIANLPNSTGYLTSVGCETNGICVAGGQATTISVSQIGIYYVSDNFGKTWAPPVILPTSTTIDGITCLNSSCLIESSTAVTSTNVNASTPPITNGALFTYSDSITDEIQIPNAGALLSGYCISTKCFIAGKTNSNTGLLFTYTIGSATFDPIALSKSAGSLDSIYCLGADNCLLGGTIGPAINSGSTLLTVK